MDQSERNKTHYRPFGFFRFFLAFLVLLSHSLPIGDEAWKGVLYPFQFGTIGVMTFFVLSGFVIAEAQVVFYSNRSGAFLTNRALRILPPYFLALAFSLLAHFGLQSAGFNIRLFDYNQLPERSFSGGNFLSNSLVLVFLYGKSALNLVPDYLFVRYIWAVAVEIHFYVIFALAFKLFWSLSEGSRAREWVFPAFFTGSLFLWTLSFFFTNPLLTYFQWSPYFLFGITLFFRVSQRGSAWNQHGLMISLICLNIHAWQHSFHESGNLGLICQVLLVSQVWLCYYLATRKVSAVLTSIDRLSGDLSYPLYLNHYVVTIAFFSLFPHGNATALFLTLITAVFVSWLLGYTVETSTRRIRASIRRAEV